MADTLALKPNERGLIVSNEIRKADIPSGTYSKFRRQIVSSVTPSIPDEQIIFGLTFRDKLAWPGLEEPLSCRPINIVGTDVTQHLDREGLLTPMTYPISGVVERISMDPDGFAMDAATAEKLYQSFKDAFHYLSERNPGQ